MSKNGVIQADDALVLRERVLTLKHLEQRSWEIWGLMRDTKTLDSEKIGSLIFESLTGAVSGVQRRLEESVVDAKSAREQLAEERSLRKAAEESLEDMVSRYDVSTASLNDRLQSTNESLRKRVDRLKSEVGMLKADKRRLQAEAKSR
jgi:uncharacterized phage infection (PIP) family protein YhgE